MRVVMRPIAFKLEEVADGDLQRSRVFLPVEIEEEIATALHDAGIDRKPHALGRFEAESHIERAEIAGAVTAGLECGTDTDVFDDRDERPELRGETARDGQWKLAIADS